MKTIRKKCRKVNKLKTTAVLFFMVLVMFFPAKALVAAESPWPVSGANAFKDRRATVNGPVASPETLWQFRVSGGTFSGDPVVGADGTIYVGTTAGAVYALDRKSGHVKWTVYPGYPIIGSPAAGSSVVYVAYGETGQSGNNFILSCLNAADGTTLWSKPGPAYAGADLPITASPTAGEDGVYVPLLYGIWKVNLSGETVWLYRGLPYLHENYCSPAVVDGRVLFVTSLGRTYVLSAADGSPMWSYLLPASPGEGIAGEITPAVSSDGKVVYYCLKGNPKVYAVRSDTWGLKWVFAAPGNTAPAAVGADGTVYAGDLEGNLSAIDPETGTRRWSFKTAEGAPVTSPAVGADGTIYLFSGLTLYSLDPGGNLKWEYNLNTGGTSCGSPVLCGNGMVLVWTCSPGGEEALLLAIGQDSSPPVAIEYSPRNGAPDVELDANLVLTFNEKVVVGEGKFILKKQVDDSIVEEIPVDDPRVEIDNNRVIVAPGGSLSYGTGYYVLVEPGAFQDPAGNKYAGINEKTGWCFSTVPSGEVPREEDDDVDNDTPAVSEPDEDGTEEGSNNQLPDGGEEGIAGPGTGDHDGSFDGGASSPDTPEGAAGKDTAAGEPGGEPGGEPPVNNETDEMPGQVYIFSDLDGHWAEKTVGDLGRRGLIRGYPDGTFRPGKRISRGEVEVLLARVTQLPCILQHEKPAGVPVAHAHTPGKERGESISRVELMVLLTRILEREIGPIAPAETGFADAAGMPEWAVRPAGVAVAGGLVVGYPDRTFRPWNSATRAEAASMILRLVRALERVKCPGVLF